MSPCTSKPPGCRACCPPTRFGIRSGGPSKQEVAQDLSSPEYLAYTRLLEAMFHGTPYAHTPLGTKPSFDKTTGAMLKRFHDTWYAPNNAILIIVGDVEPQQALAQVKRLFGEIPAKQIPERPPIRLEPVRPEAFQMKTDQPYGLVMIAFRLPGYASPDYAAAQILANVLDSQRSHLFNLVAGRKGPVCRVQQQLSARRRYRLCSGGLFQRGGPAATRRRDQAHPGQRT